MVKLKLCSPLAGNHGRRRSQRIQDQQHLKEAPMNSGDGSNQRTSPGQRRSFDDVDLSNIPPGSSSQALRKFFVANKKSRRSASATGGNNTGAGVIRRASTLFRPSSASGKRETKASNPFETMEVTGKRQDNLPALESTEMAIVNVNPVLSWMQKDAPPDVLPKILSFCGSRQVNALSRVNKSWNDLITKNELVWRTMCEDTHKWKEGDEFPDSWLRHYKENPCLPFDYDSIDAAFEAISSGPRKHAIEHDGTIFFRDQRKNARILLHPGPYFLRRTIVCNVIGSAHITIECIVGNDPNHGIEWLRNCNEAFSRKSSILKVTRPSSAQLNEVFSAGCLTPTSPHDFNESSMFDLMNGIKKGNYPLACVEGENATAFLVYEAKNQDEPCIRVRQGVVTVRGLKFLHYADGKDIWNGNAAIQVQGPFSRRRQVPIVPPSVGPTAHVIDCDIQSLSGRGIVSIDGGIARVDCCNIHNCAATGLYLGGTGSVASITCTDVYENGNGNDRRRRAGDDNVTRGHSGIYIEQGVAKVWDCNISKNSLTGMSGIHQYKATLQIEKSDFISNGSVQLELPPQGTTSRDRSYSRGNNISAFPGQGRPRTRFLKEILKPSREFSGPIGNQWAPVPQSPSEFPFDNVARVNPNYGHRSGIRAVGN